MSDTQAPFAGSFSGKRVVVTGHTGSMVSMVSKGSKGSWLHERLLSLGSEVTRPSLAFDEAKIGKALEGNAR